MPKCAAPRHVGRREPHRPRKVANIGGPALGAAAAGLPTKKGQFPQIISRPGMFFDSMDLAALTFGSARSSRKLQAFDTEAGITVQYSFFGMVCRRQAFRPAWLAGQGRPGPRVSSEHDLSGGSASVFCGLFIDGFTMSAGHPACVRLRHGPWTFPSPQSMVSGKCCGRKGRAATSPISRAFWPNRLHRVGLLTYAVLSVRPIGQWVYFSIQGDKPGSVSAGDPANTCSGIARAGFGRAHGNFDVPGVMQEMRTRVRAVCA